MNRAQMSRLADALSAVEFERFAQHVKWGEQNLPDGTGGVERFDNAEAHRLQCSVAAELGCVTWADVLEEEVAEALAEVDVTKLREELVQVAAVAIAWVEAIDRRRSS